MLFGAKLKAREFVARNDRMARGFTRRMVAVYKLAGQAIQTEAKGLAPTGRGQLKRSIKVVVKRDGLNIYGEVGTNLPQGRYTELGTKGNATVPGVGRVIKPKNGKFIAFKPTTSVKVTRKHVKGKGMVTRRRRVFGAGAKKGKYKGWVFVRWVRPIKPGNRFFPKKSWPAQKARGASGQTMPWLRVALRQKRKVALKIIDGGAAKIFDTLGG